MGVCLLALPEASLATETPLTLEAVDAILHGDVANCNYSLESHTAMIDFSMEINFPFLSIHLFYYGQILHLESDRH